MPPASTVCAIACIVVMCTAASSIAIGETYPVRPIRLIIATSPSSAADIVGRIYAQALSIDLGKTVIADNRAGAGGNLGAHIVAAAAPDGYTLLLTTPAHVISSSLSRKSAYDLAVDFAPVSQVSTGVYVIAANPSLGAQSTGQLIALAKAKPGQLNYASGGVGNATHLAVELFKSMAGIEVTHLPYQGAGPAMVALIAGESQFAAANLTAVMPHLASGKLTALAVTGARRSSFLPQVATVAESGVPGYEVTAWFGIVAPRGVAREVIAKLNSKLVREALALETRQTLAKVGAEPAVGPPETFAAFIRTERVKWAQVIARAGIANEL